MAFSVPEWPWETVLPVVRKKAYKPCNANLATKNLGEENPPLEVALYKFGFKNQHFCVSLIWS